jgi:hypothetical protein
VSETSVPVSQTLLFSGRLNAAELGAGTVTGGGVGVGVGVGATEIPSPSPPLLQDNIKASTKKV